MKTLIYRSGLATGCCPLAVLMLGLFLPLASVAEEPSMENTIAWLYKHIGSYEFSSLDESYLNRYRIFVSFAEGDIMVTEKETSSSVDRDAVNIFYSGSELKTSLSELVPEVDRRVSALTYPHVRGWLYNKETFVRNSLTEENRIELSVLTLNCRHRACVTGTVTTPSKSPSGSPALVNWSALSFYVDRDIAPRVQQALSHLIRLSGGKDAVQDDLF